MREPARWWTTQYRRLTPYLYRGIDPSAHALSWFGLKHAEYRHCLLRTSFEDYRPQRESPDRRQFDTVVGHVRRG